MKSFVNQFSCIIGRGYGLVVLAAMLHYVTIMSLTPILVGVFAASLFPCTLSVWRYCQLIMKTKRKHQYIVPLLLAWDGKHRQTLPQSNDNHKPKSRLLSFSSRNFQVS